MPAPQGDVPAVQDGIPAVPDVAPAVQDNVPEFCVLKPQRLHVCFKSTEKAGLQFMVLSLLPAVIASICDSVVQYTATKA